jgi:serine/threonine-protein kinase
VGKTRLMLEFAKKAEGAGDVVVDTGPDPTWSEVGYHALRRAIVALAALPDGGGSLSDWTAASPEARSGLSQIFGSAKDAALAPEQRRFAAAEALRWAFVRANARTGGRRVILNIDDLPSVDGASRNAFSDAAAEPPLVPALLLAALVPGFDARFPSSAPTRVLAPLQGPAVTELLSAAGATNAPTLTAGGRGIAPLYVDQMLRFVREHGGSPPSRLPDLIALRVERLHADARRALQAIAIMGDASNEDTIRPLLPEETDLPKAVTALTRAGMIEARGGAFRTTHPLLREIVLSTIPAAARRDFHTKAVHVCEMLSAPLEVLAMHEYSAQSAFEALLSLERVSALCTSRGDGAGSVMALRRGLDLARRELFRGELDDPERAVVIFSRKLGEALATLGNYTDADGVLREALDLAGAAGQDRARVLGALAHVAHGRERDREAQAYLKEALEIAHKSGAHELVHSLEDLKRSIAI